MNPYNIDWSKVSVPKGLSRDLIIKRFESSIDDLINLKNEFERFFYGKRKKANRTLHTDDIFTAINLNIKMNSNNEIDVSNLTKLVDPTDKFLYADICNHVLSYFIYTKPATDKTLNEFKLLLVYFLCKAGF